MAGGDRQAATGGAHDDVLFDASASSDGDGDPLTYLWDFGDGSAAAGARVFHVYAKPGSYKVELKVKDGSGVPCGEAVQQVTVDVRGRAGTSPAPVKPGKP
jgi:chitodextrinase